MASLPACELLADHSNEYSSVDCVKCIGEHYGSQIERLCRGRSLGAVLEHFSDRAVGEIAADVAACCRNRRAGEIDLVGYQVPETNKRAAKALVALLVLGRRYAPQFVNHRVRILPRTAELEAMLQQF